MPLPNRGDGNTAISIAYGSIIFALFLLMILILLLILPARL
jgi:hypothetical protein